MVGDMQQAAGSIVVGETQVSSCNDDLPDMPELHGASTLPNSEPHFCRKGKVQLDPPEAQNIQIFVRVLRLGLFEVLRDVIPLPQDCYATQFMPSGGLEKVPVQVEMELCSLLNNGNVWCAGPTNAGLLVPVVIGVLTFGAPFPTPLLMVLQHMSLWKFLVVAPPLWSLVALFLPLVPSSLGWCLVSSVRPQSRRAARLLRQPEWLGSLLLRLPSSPLLLVLVLVFSRLVPLCPSLRAKSLWSRLLPLSLVLSWGPLRLL